MKHRTTKAVLILSITMLITSALVYGYMIYMFKDLLAGMPGQYSTNAQSSATLGELNRVEQNLKDTLASKERLTALFVKQSAVADFIQMLELVIKKANLVGSVDSVSEEQIEGGKVANKAKLAVSITANGEWQDVLRFAGLIERIPYKSTVDSISFSPAKQAQDATNKKVISKGGWQISVKMHVMMLKSSNTQTKQ